MSRIESLLSKYKESHQHGVNRVLHTVFVPLIFLSTIGLLWDVKLGIALDFLSGEPLNAAMVVMLLVYAYYLSMSFSIALGMLMLTLFGFAACHLIELHFGIGIWKPALAFFVISWIFQFLGHRLEGKRPAFLNDIESFLVGPMWVMNRIFSILSIKY